MAALVAVGTAGLVAIDGKPLRGSQTQTSPGIHMLQAFSTRLQACVGSPSVPPEWAEVIATVTLLKDLPIGEGDVITGDAAFTDRPSSTPFVPERPDIFLFVKASQPKLQAEIAHAFGDDSILKNRRTAGHDGRAERSA